MNAMFRYIPSILLAIFTECLEYCANCCVLKRYTICDAYLLYNSRKPNKEIFASDVTRPWEYREKQLQGLIKFLDTEKEAIFKGL